jgi:hypothetical protein
MIYKDVLYKYNLGTNLSSPLVERWFSSQIVLSNTSIDSLSIVNATVESG